MSPFRKTRNSDIIGELQWPYEVTLLVAQFYSRGEPDLVHAMARVRGSANFNTCCRLRTLASESIASKPAPTCLDCAKCRGCYCCRPGHIREETVWMGKWETMDGRTLYPFEMDSMHLMNSIRKLHRDKTHFKRDWRDWVKTLECEASLRGLL